MALAEAPKQVGVNVGRCGDRDVEMRVGQGVLGCAFEVSDTSNALGKIQEYMQHTASQSDQSECFGVMIWRPLSRDGSG